MRHTTTTEKIDPLTRIQEEIKEVVRREQEHRQLTSATSVIALDNDDDYADDNNHNVQSGSKSLGGSSIDSTSLTISPDDTITGTVAAVVTSLTLNTDDNSSLASSVNSKESLDGHHSDDSGISASSSPVNGTSANVGGIEPFKASTNREQRYIGPNCYNMTPEPPQQKLLTQRAMSTPQLATTKPRQFAFNPAHKGVMQRFIASRGKLQLNNNNNNNNINNNNKNASNNIMLNGNSAIALMRTNSSTILTPPNTPMTAGLVPSQEFGSFAVLSPNSNHPSSIVIPTGSMTTATIERDADGRPIRPGYVPVELKIQRELKDLKSRESELKKIRKIRQSTSDLLDAINNENMDTDDDDSEVEHCYGPGKLRNAKSISELCDAPQTYNSSPRITPSPDFEAKMNGNRNELCGLRPAVSLAQLCDLDPEVAPSSHRLIAQWENLIQQNS